MMRIYHEHQHQSALFFWWKYSKFSKEFVMFSIPNAGKRSFKTANFLKSEGLTSGIPDIFLAAPINDFCGLFIEMKYGKNKTSKNQNRIITLLKNCRYKTSICYSWEDAKIEIENYLKPTTT